MERNRMTFDELWEQEERRGLQMRLQHDYPAWKRRRKQGIALAGTVATMLVVGIITFNFQLSTPKGYDGVICNRGGIAESHWVSVAANTLTIEANI